MLVAGALTVGMYFANRALLIHFMTERYYGRLSGGGNVLWYILCFLSVILFMESVSFFAKYLITALTDRSRYATVRKSSMENMRATEICRKYIKRCILIREMDNLVTYIIIAIIIMAYTMKDGTNSTPLIIAIFFIVIIMPLNPVTQSQVRKAKAELNSCFLKRCDAALLYDVYEQMRIYPVNGRDRKLNPLMQVELSCFLGDYPDMASKLSQCQGSLTGSYQMIYIYYRGIYALDTGDRETFYNCFREMDALVMKKKMAPPQKKLVDILRREWTIRVDLMDGDPATMIPALIQMIPTEKTEPDRMNRTFQLAWLQLKTGDREQALMNLQIVANGAGTMAIQKKAEELLLSNAPTPLIYHPGIDG